VDSGRRWLPLFACETQLTTAQVRTVDCSAEGDPRGHINKDSAPSAMHLSGTDHETILEAGSVSAPALETNPKERDDALDPHVDELVERAVVLERDHVTPSQQCR
jgi:hypothetical protein